MRKDKRCRFRSDCRGPLHQVLQEEEGQEQPHRSEIDVSKKLILELKLNLSWKTMVSQKPLLEESSLKNRM